MAPLVAEWAASSDSWHAWEANDLYWLAGNLPSTGDMASQRRRLLFGRVSAKYLSDGESARAVSCAIWNRLVVLVSWDLTDVQREAWADALCAAYIDDDQALTQLTDSEMKELSAAIFRLSTEQGNRLVSVWLASKENLSEIPAADLASLVVELFYVAKADRAKIAKLVQALRKEWSPNLDADMDWHQCRNVALAMMVLRRDESAQQGATKAYNAALGSEQLRASAELSTATQIGHLLMMTHLVGKGRSHEGIALVVARLAVAGQLAADGSAARFLGQPLGTAATRQTVQAELQDSEGEPRLSVARVLTWSYQVTGEMNEWKTFLATQIARSEGDSKARWLMARAYAETIPGRSPLGGKKWLEQAIAAAGTSACRLEAVQEVVRGYARLGKHHHGLSVLESVASQFTGDQKAKVDALRNEVKQGRERFLLGRLRRKREQTRWQAEARRAELRKRLGGARSQEEIERLERMLQEQ